MLKTPQNHSAPPYIQEKTDKRVSSFLLEYYKNLIYVYGRENMVCLELQREGGTSHFITLGSEVRNFHKVKKMGLSGSRLTLWSKTC